MSPDGFVVRVVDRVLGLLMRPRVRRVLRWSFVVTLPFFAFLVSVRGVDTVLALAALELTAFIAVLAVAARLGGERGQLIFDLVMHPAGRRLIRSEFLIVLTLPRAALRLVGVRPAGERFGYGRGNVELPLTIALTPAIAAETAALHLLLPDSLAIVRWVALGISAYGLLWLVGWAASLRLDAHRVGPQGLEARLGALYRARVPLDAIERVERVRRTAGTRTACLHDGDRVAFVVGGRTDLELELRHPVLVERPLGEPLEVRVLALAADDPAALAARLEGASPAPSPSRPRSGGPACHAIART